MLIHFPPEIIHHIALDVLDDDLAAPPTALNPLKATCKALYIVLSSAHFNARVFRMLFDTSAIARRSHEPTNEELASQLTLWCRVTVFFRGHHMPDVPPDPMKNLYAGDLVTNLVDAYQMMLEDDGKNRARLEEAGAYQFVHAFVCKRLMREDSGWPADNVQNACVLWLLWRLTTEERLVAEFDALREYIVNLILPYSLIPCRYPTSYVPAAHFSLPLSPTPSLTSPSSITYTIPHSLITAHGPYPPYPSESSTISACSYNSRYPFTPGPIAIPATLLYFSRRELQGFGVPPHLAATREEARRRALERGEPMEVGPTQEDVREFNMYRDTRLPVPTPREGWSGVGEPASKAWDDDYFRTRYCHSPFLVSEKRNGNVYTPGQLNGLFQGRMSIPSEHLHEALVTTPNLPEEFTEGTAQVTTVPLYMRLTEYHFVSSSKTAAGVARRKRAKARAAAKAASASAATAEATGPGTVQDAAMDTSTPILSVSSTTTYAPTQNTALLLAAQHSALLAQLQREDDEERRGDPDARALVLGQGGGVVGVPRKRGRLDEGMRNAWFPLGVRTREVGGSGAEAGLNVYVPRLPTDLDESHASMGHRYTTLSLDESWSPSNRDAEPSFYERSQPYHAPTSYANTSSTKPPNVAANSHDPEGCAECTRRSIEEGYRRRIESAAHSTAFTNRMDASSDTSLPSAPSQNIMESLRLAELAAEDAAEQAELEALAQVAAEEEEVLIRALGPDGVENMFRSVGLGYGHGRRKLNMLRKMKAGKEPKSSRNCGGGGHARPQWGAGREFRTEVDPAELAALQAARQAPPPPRAGVAPVQPRDGDVDMDDEDDWEEYMDEDDYDDDDDEAEEDPNERRALDADLPSDDPRVAPPCAGIRDIIVSGATDERHGQAWNHFVYRGRVRPFDGLVGILRISRDRRLGDIFMSGYLTGGQNLVGTWRIAHAGPEAPVWESSFTMSRREE